MDDQYTFKVKGTYHDAKRRQASLDVSPGDRLECVPDPDNPHDRFAIALYKKDRMLGWVPIELSKTISSALKLHGNVYTVEVISVSDEDGYKGIFVKMHKYKDEKTTKASGSDEAHVRKVAEPKSEANKTFAQMKPATISDIVPFLTNLILPGNVAMFPKKVEDAICEVMSERYGAGWQQDDAVRELLTAAVSKLGENFDPDRYREDVPYAYATYYLPQNFHKTQLMILDLLREGAWMDIENVTVLDIGCSVGTSTLAILDFFEILDKTLKLFRIPAAIKQISVLPVDKSPENLQVHGKIMDSYFKRLDKDFRGKVAVHAAQEADVMSHDFKPAAGSKFDFIIMSNVLNELERKEDGASYTLIKNMHACLKKGGHILLIEPAEDEATYSLRQTVHRLVGDGLYTAVGPCSHGADSCSKLACSHCWSFRKELLNVPDIYKVIENKKIQKRAAEIDEKIAVSKDGNGAYKLVSHHDKREDGAPDDAAWFLREKIIANVSTTINEELDCLAKNLRNVISRVQHEYFAPIKNALLSEGGENKKLQNIIEKRLNEAKKDRAGVKSKIQDFLKNAQCDKCEGKFDGRVTKDSNHRLYLACECGEKVWQDQISKYSQGLATWAEKERVGVTLYVIDNFIDQCEAAKQAIEIKALLSKERIESWKTELVNKSVEEEHYEKQYLYPKLKWSYAILACVVAPPVKYEERCYRVVSSSLYVSEIQGVTTTVYKICSLDEAGERPVFLRFGEDIIPDEIRFGDVLKIGDLEETSIDEAGVKAYMRVFGRNFMASGELEIYVDTYAKLHSIEIKKSYALDAKKQGFDIGDYFKGHYAASIGIYAEAAKNAEVEHVVSANPEVREKKEDLRYFLTRIRPDVHDFREGQFNAIARMLSGEKTFCIMATGGGKSLCFQFPAIFMKGVSIVIAPLKSLIKDQVQGLKRRGFFLQVASISGGGSSGKEYTLRRMARGYYKLVYMTPEQLDNYDVLKYIEQLEKNVGINYVIIDEAHCVSQWGHDFRPSYLAIKEKQKRYMSGARVACFTATASENVIDDLKQEYEFTESDIIRQGFFRKELCLKTVFTDNDQEKAEFVYQIASKNKNNSPLVFTPYTVKGRGDIVYYAEDLSDHLKDQGVNSDYHHSNEDKWRKQTRPGDANLPSGDADRLNDIERHDFERRKERAMEKFIHNRKDPIGGIDVLCATKGFGMGIDKGDIEVIVHTNMPASYEDYYQQIGRAARRDDLTADCFLLVSNLPKEGECDRDCVSCREDRFDCYKQARLLQRNHSEISTGDGNMPLLNSILASLDNKDDSAVCEGVRYKFIELKWDKARKDYFIPSIGRNYKLFGRYLNVLQRCRSRKVLNFHKIYNTARVELDYDYILNNDDRDWVKAYVKHVRHYLHDKNGVINLKDIAIANGLSMSRLRALFDTLKIRHKNAVRFTKNEHGGEWEDRYLEVAVDPGVVLSGEEIAREESRLVAKIHERRDALLAFIDWVQEKSFCKKELLANYFMSNEALQSEYCYGCDVCAEKLHHDMKLGSADDCDRFYLRDHKHEVITTSYDRRFISLEQEIEKKDRTEDESDALFDKLNEYASCLKTQRYGSRLARMLNHYEHKDHCYFEACYVLALVAMANNKIEDSRRYFFNACKVSFSLMAENKERVSEKKLCEIIEAYEEYQEAFCIDKDSGSDITDFDVEKISGFADRLFKSEHLYGLFAELIEKNAFCSYCIKGFINLLKRKAGDADDNFELAIKNAPDGSSDNIDAIIGAIKDRFRAAKIGYEYFLSNGSGTIDYEYFSEMADTDILRTIEYIRKKTQGDVKRRKLYLASLKAYYSGSTSKIPKKELVVIEDLLLQYNVIDAKQLKTPRDLKLRCNKCQSGFLFTIYDQENFRGWNRAQPEKCLPCRIEDDLKSIESDESRKRRGWEKDIAMRAAELEQYLTLHKKSIKDRFRIIYWFGVACYWADKQRESKACLEYIKKQGASVYFKKCQEYLDDLQLVRPVDLSGLFK